GDESFRTNVRHGYPVEVSHGRESADRREGGTDAAQLPATHAVGFRRGVAATAATEGVQGAGRSGRGDDRIVPVQRPAEFHARPRLMTRFPTPPRGERRGGLTPHPHCGIFLARACSGPSFVG